MSRKRALKALQSMKRGLIRPSKRRHLLGKIWWIIQIILLGAMTLCVSRVVSRSTDFFKERVPMGNESWAIAMIALPIALFGIQLTVSLPTKQKYSERFKGESLDSIYKSGAHFFDFTFIFYIQAFTNAVFWVNAYFALNYPEMIARALVLSGEILYLIAFTFWKYTQTPNQLYLENIMKYRFKLVEDRDVEQKCYEQLNPLFKEKKSEEILSVIEDNYSLLWEELNSLSLSIISSQESAEERAAILSIIERIGEMELNETNALILYSTFSTGSALCEMAIKRNDYIFAVKLANTMLESWIAFLAKYIKFVRCYTSNIGILNDEYDFLLVKEVNLIKDINMHFSQRLNAYSQILLLFNEKIDKLVPTLQDNEIKYFISIKSYNQYTDLSRNACDCYKNLNEFLQEKDNQKFIEDAVEVYPESSEDA